MMRREIDSMLKSGSTKIAIVGAVILAASVACSSGPPPPADERPYEQRVIAARAAKDAMFRTTADSPIPAPDRAGFKGLPYFPIDPAYHVPAVLTEIRGGPPVVIQLPTSQGLPRRERKIGSLGFSIGGASYALTAFFDEDEGLTKLFVPFGDLTNNKETYGGGRYLDLTRTTTGLYDLDFNGAYHPYCVYNPTFDCPIPPAENRLKVAIRAGERLMPPDGAVSH
ncbi:MAG: DUF1684 domain-containing protein [Acidobacteriota bacterium]